MDKLNIGTHRRNWDRLREELPKKVAARAITFWLDAFKKGGWTDTSFTPWKERKDKKNTRNLLVKKGVLRSKVNNSLKSATWDVIKFEVDLPYAKIHLEGFDGEENVREHRRKKRERVKVYSVRTHRGTSVKVEVGDTIVKAHTRHMKMPKRKYMGSSEMLRQELVKFILEEINKCFK